MAVTFPYKNHKIRVSKIRSTDKKRRLFTYEVIGKYASHSVMGWKLAMRALKAAKSHIDLSELVDNYEVMV